MALLNSIVDNRYFKQSSLYASFLKYPLGFIGSAINVICSMSANKSKTIGDSLNCLIENVNANPSRSYLLAKKFIDTHKSNSDISFLKLET